MKYYPNTCNYLMEAIKNSTSNIHFNDTKNHLLWMMDELQLFDDAAKRGRWIGWILAKSEDMEILNTEKSIELIRVDVKSEKY